MDNGVILDTRDLGIEFGGVRAVDGVSLTVRRGAITGLIGPNGAGKTSVIGLIAGTLRGGRGSVLFCGEQVLGQPMYRIARRGLIRTFQASSEFRRLTVLQNLLIAAPHQVGEHLWAALLGARTWRDQEWAAIEEARDLLRRFGLAHKESEYAGNLSGGQKRILELLRAVMGHPTLLVLDEPVAGVHPSVARQIAAYLESLLESGVTILLVEHDLKVVERLCQMIVVMAQGRVIASGSMAELRRNRDVVNAYLAG